MWKSHSITLSFVMKGSGGSECWLLAKAVQGFDNRQRTAQGRSELALIKTNPLGGFPRLTIGSWAWVRTTSVHKLQVFTTQKTEAWKHWCTLCVLLLLMMKTTLFNVINLTAHRIKLLSNNNKTKNRLKHTHAKLPTHATDNEKWQRHLNVNFFEILISHALAVLAEIAWAEQIPSPLYVAGYHICPGLT